MQEIHEFAESLKAWAREQRLEERSIQHFLTYLDEYRKEEPKEFAETFPDFERNHLRIAVSGIAFVSHVWPGSHWPENSSHSISVSIPMVYQQKQLGVFYVIFAPSGALDTETACFASEESPARGR